LPVLQVMSATATDVAHSMILSCVGQATNPAKMTESIEMSLVTLTQGTMY